MQIPFIFLFLLTGVQAVDYLLRMTLHIPKASDEKANLPFPPKDLMVFVNDVLKIETGIHIRVLSLNETDDPEEQDKYSSHTLYQLGKDEEYTEKQYYKSVVLNLYPLKAGKSMTGGISTPPLLFATKMQESGEAHERPLVVVTYDQATGMETVGYHIISHILHVFGFHGKRDKDKGEEWGYGCNCSGYRHGDEVCLLFPVWYKATKNSGTRKGFFPACVRQIIQGGSIDVQWMDDMINLSNAVAELSPIPICGNGVRERSPAGEEDCDCKAGDLNCPCDPEKCTPVPRVNKPAPPPGHGSRIQEAKGKIENKSTYWIIVGSVIGLVALSVLLVLTILFVRGRKKPVKMFDTSDAVVKNLHLPSVPIPEIILTTNPPIIPITAPESISKSSTKHSQSGSGSKVAKGKKGSRANSSTKAARSMGSSEGAKGKETSGKKKAT